MRDTGLRCERIRRNLKGLGQVEGALEGNCEVYRGIRYAMPPVGALRFEAPHPVKAWQGVITALEFAPASPQAPRAEGQSVFGDMDCLALNIWCPANTGAACPVMVWIPGGAYMRGNSSDPIYDGAAFARHGIVFVSFNYRVGIDGFMQIPGAPANRGLLDQIAALKWINEHIEQFGGDPAQITVAGGSAGAGAISCLLGIPEAGGLFSQVILQSPSVATQTLEEADVASAAIAHLLDVKLDRKSLAAVPVAQAVAAVQRLAENPELRRSMGFSSRNFFPLRAVVDGQLLRKAPVHALRDYWKTAEFKPALLVGCNKEEMRLYAVPDAAMDRVTQSQLDEFMSDCGVSRESAQTLQRRLADQGRHGPGEILCALQSDYFYRMPARQIASDAAAAGAPVYLYEFEWESTRYGGVLGAAHGLEIPFVFDNLATESGREVTGVGAPEKLAKTMHSAWVQFVKRGSDVWAPYSSERRERMKFGVEVACETDEFEN